MRRAFSSSIRAILTLFAVGCSTDSDIAGPDPEPLGPPAELMGSAIRLHVDLRGGKVTVTQPSLVEATAERNGLKPSFALLGQNEIEAEVTEVSRSAVGEFTYNRVRVTLNLALKNKLLNADLVPSTFPAPPSAQVVAFPFGTVPAGLFGLKVRTSPDWDGAPHNFFNDGLCLGLPTPPADCFRWEGFGEELEAGATTEARKVGFDVDPSVTSFTVYVAFAADLDEQPTAGTGTIEGTIRSTLFGPLEGAIVTASPGGQSTTSDANGAYVLTDLAAGTHSLTVTATPASCFRAVPLPVAVEARLTARADFALRCRRIAFTSIRDGNQEIYVMHADGTGPVRLTNDPAPDAQPTWSPDGSRLAFVRGGIHIMNADGTDLLSLGVSGLTPAWSADGSRIAFTLNSDVFVVNTDGTSQTQLTEALPGGTNLAPAWSPDGSRMAFSERLPPIFDPNQDSFFSDDSEIVSINSTDGTDLVRLTNNSPERVFDVTLVANDDTQPDWSPDGSKLAFVRDNDIYVMTLAGATVRLTHAVANPPNRYTQPTWSPDGSQIAFTLRTGLVGAIYTMNADGTGLTRLSSGTSSDTDPAW